MSQPQDASVTDLRAAPVAGPPPVGESSTAQRGLFLRLVPLLLFVATCCSTFLAGMYPGLGMPVDPRWASMPPADVIRDLLSDSEAVRNGIRYCGAVMLILLAHEMGHWLQCRRCRVRATLPFFIPLPIVPFGTLGAGIVMNSRDADRRDLFDIAISGPLAGLLLAIPIVWSGVRESRVLEGSPLYGHPLLVQWMFDAVHGPIPAGMHVELNPLLFAGWVGLFITSLNLMPYGHLDGGHILYALVGRRALAGSIGVLVAAVSFMIAVGYPMFAGLVILLLLMGPVHPPTANDQKPLGAVRHVAGWLTLAFVVVGFTPMPIDIERFEQLDVSVSLPEHTTLPVPVRHQLDHTSLASWLPCRTVCHCWWIERDATVRPGPR